MRHPLLSCLAAATVLTLAASCAHAVDGAPQAATVLRGSHDTGPTSKSHTSDSDASGSHVTEPDVTDPTVAPPTTEGSRTEQSTITPPTVTATVTVTKPGADSRGDSSGGDARPPDRSTMTKSGDSDTTGPPGSATRSGETTTSPGTNRPTHTVTAPTRATGESTATVSDHGITIAVGKPTGVIDFYEDALCPICGQFEAQYGATIRQAIDNGALSARYRMVDFLNRYSASGSYSTRAFAAMLTLTRLAGKKPGLVEAFHASLFDASIQPKEKGSVDLSNATMADLAAQLGAPDKAVAAIASGADVDRATIFANANLQRLKHISDNPGTPTVARGDTVIPLTANWLDTALNGGDG